MPEGQLSVSHSPLLTEESISTGLGSMSDGPNSNGAEFCPQMRADSLLTKMMDVRESGDEQERDLPTPVLQNMTVTGEAASWCGEASPMATVLVSTWSQGEQ